LLKHERELISAKAAVMFSTNELGVILYCSVGIGAMLKEVIALIPKKKTFL